MQWRVFSRRLETTLLRPEVPEKLIDLVLKTRSATYTWHQMNPIILNYKCDGKLMSGSIFGAFMKRTGLRIIALHKEKLEKLKETA